MDVSTPLILNCIINQMVKRIIKLKNDTVKMHFGETNQVSTEGDLMTPQCEQIAKVMTSPIQFFEPDQLSNCSWTRS